MTKSLQWDCLQQTYMRCSGANPTMVVALGMAKQFLQKTQDLVKGCSYGVGICLI